MDKNNPKVTRQMSKRHTGPNSHKSNLVKNSTQQVNMEKTISQEKINSKTHRRRHRSSSQNSAKRKKLLNESPIDDNNNATPVEGECSQNSQNSQNDHTRSK